MKERLIKNNVFKYFGEIYPSESKIALLELTVRATGSSKTSIRILKEKHGLKSPRRKKPNRKSEFSKLDKFDLGVIRIVHPCFARNESPSLPKLLKKLKEKINFPYSKSTLHLLLKKLGFRYKVRERLDYTRKSRFG